MNEQKINRGKVERMGETRNKGKCSRVELLWPSEHEIVMTSFVIDVHRHHGSTSRELGRGQSV